VSIAIYCLIYKAELIKRYDKLYHLLKYALWRRVFGVGMSINVAHYEENLVSSVLGAYYDTTILA
jgi:hypothetical protein